MERISVQELAGLFEIPLGHVPNIEPTNEAQLRKQVNKFKTIFKKQYRILVKKYHPDVAEDKELAHEKLIKLNKYIKAINTMEVKIHRPPVVHEYRFEFKFYGGTGTTSNTSGTFWGNIWS